MERRSVRIDLISIKQNLPQEQKPSLTNIKILVDGHLKAARNYKDLNAVAEGIFLTRDLVSEPPNVLFPASFAKKLQDLKQDGVKVEVLGEKEMIKLGMGALVGVGSGSSKESKLVRYAMGRW